MSVFNLVLLSAPLFPLTIASWLVSCSTQKKTRAASAKTAVGATAPGATAAVAVMSSKAGPFSRERAPAAAKAAGGQAAHASSTAKAYVEPTSTTAAEENAKRISAINALLAQKKLSKDHAAVLMTLALEERLRLKELARTILKL